MAWPLTRWWAVEHGLAPAAPRDEHDVTQKGGQFFTMAPPSAWEPSSWPERPERSLSMVWL
jgi:hypothetical protein